jgi:hypothetical protein
LDGFNQNLPPGHGFRSDPPGKKGFDDNDDGGRKEKVLDPDKDDDTKPTLRTESPVLTLPKLYFLAILPSRKPI